MEQTTAVKLQNDSRTIRAFALLCASIVGYNSKTLFVEDHRDLIKAAEEFERFLHKAGE